MNKEIILSHYDKLNKYAKTKFFKEEDQEDFLSFSIEKIIRNESRAGSYKNLYTDYIRATLGDSRVTKSSNPAAHIVNYHNISDIGAPQEEKPEGEIQELMPLVSKKHKKILSVIPDLEHAKELCNILKVSESRVSQIIKEIREEIKIKKERLSFIRLMPLNEKTKERISRLQYE